MPIHDNPMHYRPSEVESAAKDLGPLDFTGRFGGGLLRDLKRRAPFFCSPSGNVEAEQQLLRSYLEREIHENPLKIHENLPRIHGTSIEHLLFSAIRGDWTDAFMVENIQKSLATILYLFIAALAPAITPLDV